MYKTSTSIRTICEIGIFAALGFVLDELQGILSKGLFINGGSIGFAMVAVLIIAYRRGLFPAILTGLIMGLLDIATSAYIVHPAQLFLDYILPYAFVGVAGFFKPLFQFANERKEKITWLVLGTVVAGFFKLASHYLAGIMFWADPQNFAWNLNEMNPFLYCFIYNIAFMGPSIVLSALIMVALFVRAPQVLVAQMGDTPVDPNARNKIRLVASILYLAGGSFLFVYFLIDYIKSFSDYQDGNAYGYDFNPDSMIIFIIGLFFILLGVAMLLAHIKGRFSSVINAGLLTTISSISFIYGLSRLIRMYVKGKDPTTYWIWFAVSLTGLVVCSSLLIYFLIKRKQMKE